MIQAVLAATGIGGKVLKRLKGRAAREREREANMDAVYQAGVQGFDVPSTLGKPKDPLDWLKYQAENSATPAGKAHAAQLYHQLAAQQHDTHAKGAAAKRAASAETDGDLNAVENFVATPGGARAVGTVAREVLRGAVRRRRASYYDQYGRRRYRYSSSRGPSGPSEEEMSPDDAAGATIDEQGDTGDQGFFSADVSQLKGTKAAGAAALVVGAGVGAYYVTKNLLDYLGQGARSREDLRVQATLAFHQALEDYRQEHGDYPPPAQRQAMKNAWAMQLAQIQGGQIQQLYDSFVRTYGEE